jgi:imidazoleglycerol phosphate dehydratase HisB
MVKTITKEQQKEIEKLYKRLHEITGTCFACCNVKVKGDKDDEGHTINCKVGRCIDLGQCIATALKDEKELRECVDMFLNAGDSLEKIKKALKGFLDELDK